MSEATPTFTFRLKPELRERLRQASLNAKPYSIPMARIVERGVILAIEEIEKLNTTGESP